MKDRSFPSFLGQWRSRLAVGLFAAVALGVATVSCTTGLGRGLEQNIQLWRDVILRHSASQRVGLVEIDARSLKVFDSWPWPRGLHAKAIAALDGAGAKAIAFDVDFSAKSSLDQDTILAQAIGGAHAAIYLPTFRQADSQGSHDLLENLPLPSLREHAELASVNIAPDSDGFIRSLPYGVITSGFPRPSLAAMLAGTSGRINKNFPIDWAIDETTVLRISFADLVEGRVPPSVIRGRSFLVGATAVEMGDRYAVPGHGVIPGALVELLAAETLIGHSIPVDHGPLAGLGILLALISLRFWRTQARHPAFTGLSIGALLVLPLGLQAAGLGVVSIVPALLGIAILANGDAIIATLAALRESRLTDPQSGLPNARSLRESVAKVDHGQIVVLRVANYGDVLNVLGQANTGILMQRMAQRLSFVATPAIYHVEPNALAWFDTGTDQEAQIEQPEAVIALFNQPVEIEGRALRIAPALGTAPIASSGSRALDHALVAANEALAKGSRWEWYNADSEAESDWRLSLAAELDTALKSGAIYVVYQPKYDIKAMKINAAEALVRWHHPTRGPIPPESLIALVEEHGMIGPLTLHVLRTALEDQQRWTHAGVLINVAVNISALLPADNSFICHVEALLSRYPGSATCLTLEVTESTPMIHTGAVIGALERLTKLGVAISIDDYGTGQSTLSYLRNLPAREIKIDKSFVIGMAASRSDQLMVTSTIALAHELGYKVVAEGVETVEILDLLTQAGCDVAQGWHIGRPMTADLLVLAAGGQQLAA